MARWWLSISTRATPIFVEGRLTYNSWEKDGQKRSKLTVTADDFQFVGGKGEGLTKGSHISTSGPDSSTSEPSPRFPDDAPAKDNEVPF